jgi:transcriptional regulator with XRE-family HTH domain
MPISALTGTRLRERRQAVGLKQAELAALAGISASYLNLIEHNRRRVAGDVLVRLADALGLDVTAIAEGRQAALLEDLRAAAAGAEGAGAELDRLEDFVGRFPGWAALLAGSHGRVMGLERAVEALNDRMTHDPHLRQALHEVLSSLSSVRSTAAILAETEDLDPEWSLRFRRNLHEDSERLATGAEALVAFLDAGMGAEEQGIATPQEELESWLGGRGWHLEDAELATGCEAEVAQLASGAARSLARAYVARAAADAQALPLAPFRSAVAEIGLDPWALAVRFGAGVPAVMRRLATLPGVVAGLVSCDGSGTLLFRKPVPGFPLPRFGAACPLWPLYVALGRPMMPVETVVEMAGRGGSQHRVLAYCTQEFPDGARGPELREAVMLILPAAERQASPLPIGSTCRVCPRMDCTARREPSILSESL